MNDYDDMTTVTIKIMGVSTSLMAALPGWVRARPRERSEEVMENWMMNDDYFRMQSTTRQMQIDN